MEQNEAVKTLVFVLMMLGITFIPAAIIIGGVMIMMGLMKRKRRSFTSEDDADTTATRL